MGDFNQNLSFRDDNMKTLLEITDALGLVSAYHSFFQEDFGEETRPTHFPHGKGRKSSHLDYCFLPKEWIPMIDRVEVGTYSEWGQISDHVPLIVDLKLS
jgi:endonuclease/exonuclease/phosphatase family metal-dependent hydrolase